MTETYRVASVQAEPEWLDLDAGVEKTIALIRQAADAGASLVAFPELWLPGYPIFLWLDAVVGQVPFVARYHASSMSTRDPRLARVRRAARESNIAVALGWSEKDHGSLYVAQTLIGADGAVQLHRRKLKPTHVERTLFGESDGSHLAVVDTDLGRIGALCCWEHLQPLSKYALYAQHEQVHVASWPAFGLYAGLVPQLGAEANLAASQTYALEGGCFVLVATQVLGDAAIRTFAQTDAQRDLLSPGWGSSRVYGPDSALISDPLDGHLEGVVTADVDLAAIDLAKNAADPAGHYARPDATRLVHDRRARRPVLSADEADDHPFPELDPVLEQHPLQA